MTSQPTHFLTSSDIVAIETQLRDVDPRLLDDPAMLVAMAIKLDDSDDAQAAVKESLCQYVAFRWPNFQRDLRRSIEKRKLMGALLRDSKARNARMN